MLVATKLCKKYYVALEGPVYISKVKILAETESND